MFIKVLKVGVVNGATRIQIDAYDEENQEELTLFVKTVDIFKAINNYLQETQEIEEEKTKGIHKLVDQENQDIIN